MAVPKNTPRRMRDAAKLMDSVAAEMAGQFQKMITSGEQADESLSSYFWKLEKAVGAARMIREAADAMTYLPAKGHGTRADIADCEQRPAHAKRRRSKAA